MTATQQQSIPESAQQFLAMYLAVRHAQKRYYASERGSYARANYLKESKILEQKCETLREALAATLTGMEPCQAAHRNHFLILRQMCGSWHDLYLKQVKYWDSKEYAISPGDEQLLQQAKDAERAADRALPKWQKALQIFDSQLNAAKA